MEKNISVLMSVYKNDKSEYLIEAMESIVNQSLTPKQIVFIVDGPISEELMQTVKDLEKKYPIIELYVQEQNQGLGKTMLFGIEKCKYEYIARMDADDVSALDRFEKEYEYMQNNNLDLVGSCVNEFVDTVDNIVAKKMVPAGQNEIIKFSKTRCPFCHPSVMFKKQAIIKAGNYQDMKLCEDYYLWIRLIQSGAKVDNIQEPLLNMRVSMEMYARRGGYKYYKSQKQLLKYMLKTKYIGYFTYLKSCIIRFCVQVLMPNKLRQKFYLKALRKR